MKIAHHIVAITILSSWPCFGAQIQSVKVAGDSSAEVSFLSDTALPSMPKLNVDGNRVDLTFPGVSVAASLLSQSEISSPHALVQKITVSALEGGGAQVRLVVNGSTEKLRDRVKLQKNDGTVALVLTYPSASTATLKLFQEEQSSIATAAAPSTEAKGGFGWFRLLLIMVLFAAAGATTWFVVKFAKKRAVWSGSRKHLIELVASAAVGDNKASVAIVRVGTEFVMVGVTASQVNLISRLPKLEAQFEEESSLERGSFKEAIEEEVRRNGRAGLTA